MGIAFVDSSVEHYALIRELAWGASLFEISTLLSGCIVWQGPVRGLMIANRRIMLRKPPTTGSPQPVAL